MKRSNTTRILFLAVFLSSLALRLALVAFNREANDSHETVAQIILSSHKLPQLDDCWECFQPKLFHAVFALGIKMAGLDGHPGYQQNVVGQFINFLAAALSLLVVWALIWEFPRGSAGLKLLAFALAALNPALVGINAQATNDTFVILFSTLAIFFTYRFFQKEKPAALALALLSLLLGISSKTNAWVTVVAVFAALAIRAWVAPEQRARKGLLAAGFLGAVLLLSILNPLNQYISNYRRYGSPEPIAMQTAPLPPFWGKLTGPGNGIWYVQEGFFTFRFADLLRHPRLEPDSPLVMPQQTSFWTILYGRAHSIHFDNSPPSWSTSGTELFGLSRGIFILALLPSILLLMGAILQAFLASKSIAKRDLPAAREIHFGLFALAFIGYVLFEMLYALEYRSLTVIKAIFIYPALPAFPLLFLYATDWLLVRLPKWKPWLVYISGTAIVILSVGYVADVAALIVQLGRVYFAHHG